MSARRAKAVESGWTPYKDHWYTVRGDFFHYLWERPTATTRPEIVRVTTYVKPLAVDDIVREYLPHTTQTVGAQKLLSLRCDGVDSVRGLTLSDREIDQNSHSPKISLENSINFDDLVGDIDGYLIGSLANDTPTRPIDDVVREIRSNVAASATWRFRCAASIFD